MTHLSDEELEGILQGDVSAPAHLGECELCRDRLAESRAIRSRLRSAFDGVHAPRELAERIRSRTGRPISRLARGARGGGRATRLIRWALPLTAAAAALLIAVPLIVFFTGPSPAGAAQAELFNIHRHSLSDHAEIYSDADPESLAKFIRNKLGFTPAFPRLGAGMSLRGCCIAYFRDKPVGSYVVDTPRGVISIIVVTETPKALGMTDTLRHGGRTYPAGAFAKSNMVTSVLDGYTYCAVGEVPGELLADLLAQLVR